MFFLSEDLSQSNGNGKELEMPNDTKISRISDFLKLGFNEEELVSDFVRVNEETWPPPIPQEYVWTIEKVERQFKNCPHLLYAALIDGEVACTLSMIYKNESDVYKCSSWHDISGHGTLDTHDENGDSVFGIDLSVSPKYQGKKLADNTMQKAFLVSVILGNKKGAFLGSRIPSYHRYAEKVGVEDYVFGKNRNSRTRDPEIKLYQSTGFRPVKIVPGYMDDPDSLNYGVLMFWENPFYKYTRHMKTLTRLAQFVTAKILFR